MTASNFSNYDIRGGRLNSVEIGEADEANGVILRFRAVSTGFRPYVACGGRGRISADAYIVLTQYAEST